MFDNNHNVKLRYLYPWNSPEYLAASGVFLDNCSLFANNHEAWLASFKS